MPAKVRAVRGHGRSHKDAVRAKQELPKAPSGILGLDEITGGGLPRGRPTLVCGGAGCGKTLFATELLVRGASKYGEPGVFIDTVGANLSKAEKVLFGLDLCEKG